MQVFGDDLPTRRTPLIIIIIGWKVHPWVLEMYLVFQFSKEISCYLWYKMERNYCMILTKQLILSMGSFAVWYAIIEKDEFWKRVVWFRRIMFYLSANQRFSAPSLSTCNGRDWWIIVLDSDGVSVLYILLTLPSHTIPKNIGKYNLYWAQEMLHFHTQEIGYAVCDGRYWDSIGVVHLWFWSLYGLVIKSFFLIPWWYPKSSVGQSVAFLPNDRYLYVNNMNDLYQYDMSDLHKPRIHIATYDGFYDGDNPNSERHSLVLGLWAWWAPLMFPGMQPVQDTCTSWTILMKGCSVLPTACHSASRITHGLPNFPHTASALWMDRRDAARSGQPPRGGFRYEPDSLDYLRLRFTDLSYFRPGRGHGTSVMAAHRNRRKSIPSPHQGVYRLSHRQHGRCSNTLCRDICPWD